MGKINICSNVKDMREEIQEEVDSFREGTQFAVISDHIRNKFRCDIDVREDMGYIYCYFPQI